MSYYTTIYTGKLHSVCAPNDVWNFSIELEFRYLQAKPHNLQGLWRLCGAAECGQWQWCYHPSLLIPEEIIPVPCHIAAVLCRDTSTVSSSWHHCHSYTRHPHTYHRSLTMDPLHNNQCPLWTSVKWPNNPNINIRTVSRGINLLALYCTVMSECTVLMTECTVFTCQCTVLMGKHLNVSPGDGLNNI